MLHMQTPHFLSQITQCTIKKNQPSKMKKKSFEEFPQVPAQISSNIPLTEVTQPIFMIAVTLMFGGVQHRSLKQATLFILCINLKPSHRNSCAHSF